MSITLNTPDEVDEHSLRRKVLIEGLRELVSLVGQDQLKTVVLALSHWEDNGFNAQLPPDLACDLPHNFIAEFHHAHSNGYVNIALVGPANTGKSRAGEILPKILYGFHMIEHPTFKRVRWSALSQWDAQWNKQISLVDDIFRTLPGGILVIDPVLPQNLDDPHGIDRKIIHNIATNMIARKDILVIFVGSEKIMRKIYSMNPVIKNCIAMKIDFSSYTPAQLLRVVEDKAHVNFFSLSKDAKEFLQNRFTQLVFEGGPNIFEKYGNAFLAQEIVTRAAASHQRRWAHDHMSIPFYQYVDQYVQYWQGDTELSVHDVTIGLEDSLCIMGLCA